MYNFYLIYDSDEVSNTEYFFEVDDCISVFYSQYNNVCRLEIDNLEFSVNGHVLGGNEGVYLHFNNFIDFQDVINKIQNVVNLFYFSHGGVTLHVL